MLELLHFLGSATLRKRVVGQMIDVVDPVVGIKKCLYIAPGAVDRVRLIASTLINETDRVI
jgi:hypothetical protein